MDEKQRKDDFIAEGQILTTEQQMRQAMMDYIIITLDVGLAEGKSYHELATKIVDRFESL